MKTILAFDPGGTTGWASYTEVEDAAQGDDWNRGQLGPEEHHVDLWRFLVDYVAYGSKHTDDLTIVCESFEFRQNEELTRHNIVLDSKEYIGVIKLFGKMSGTPVVFQTAGLAKGFIPDKAKNGLKANEKLKVLGLYTPAMPHANDAMRHLVTYMVKGLKRYDIVEKWKDL